MIDRRLESFTVKDLVHQANTIKIQPASDPIADSNDRVALAIYEVGSAILERLDLIQARLVAISTATFMKGR